MAKEKVGGITAVRKQKKRLPVRAKLIPCCIEREYPTLFIKSSYHSTECAEIETHGCGDLYEVNLITDGQNVTHVRGLRNAILTAMWMVKDANDEWRVKLNGGCYNVSNEQMG